MNTHLVQLLDDFLASGLGMDTEANVNGETWLSFQHVLLFFRRIGYSLLCVIQG